jgi:mitochondrial import inner membrane translocase subunit TIM22
MSNADGAKRPDDLQASSPQHRTIFDHVMSQPEPTSNQYSPSAALHRPVPPYNDADLRASVLQAPQLSSPYSLPNITRRSLPYFLAWSPTGSSQQQVPPDFSWLSNSCGGKAAIGVFGGGVMGLLMGVFLGAMSDATPPVQYVAGKIVPPAPLREQFKVTLRATAQKSMYWCKNFAFITGVFGGSECLVEKYRGKHDVWNSVASGCLTGAALQAKSGVQAAAVGCGGFAAFSLVIDSFMGHY